MSVTHLSTAPLMNTHASCHTRPFALSAVWKTMSLLSTIPTTTAAGWGCCCFLSDDDADFGGAGFLLNKTTMDPRSNSRRPAPVLKYSNTCPLSILLMRAPGMVCTPHPRTPMPHPRIPTPHPRIPTPHPHMPTETQDRHGTTSTGKPQPILTIHVPWPQTNARSRHNYAAACNNKTTPQPRFAHNLVEWTYVVIG